MIRTIYYLAIFSIAAILNLAKAQDFHGQAVYESKTLMKDKVKITSSDMTPEMVKQMEERMAKAFERTFVLNFNRTESTFTQEEKLEVGTPQSGGTTFKINIDGVKYSNLKEKMTYDFVDSFGKEFLVYDSLKNWEWKLESETKKIGNYMCNKAVAVVKPSEKAMEKYKEQQAKKEKGETMIFSMNEPKDQVFTVWYTPEIPVSHGPANYWSLPGLVLEANDGHTIYLCSKITLNPKDKKEIKRPTKGKKVTREEHEKIMEKQFENMQDSKGRTIIRIGN